MLDGLAETFPDAKLSFSRPVNGLALGSYILAFTQWKPPMMRKLPILLLSVALVACNREHSAAPAATTSAPAAATPGKSASVVRAPPAAALTQTGDAHINGYGHLHFGMNADEMKKAWGGELNGKPGAGVICYYLAPNWVKAPGDFGLMMESDKFVRYDVGTDKETAPGGGKLGMGIAEIRKLYAGHVTETPHKYIKGGIYLRVESSDESGGVVLFETDATGKVTTWRVGQVPQIDYVERCG